MKIYAAIKWKTPQQIELFSTLITNSLSTILCVCPIVHFPKCNAKNVGRNGKMFHFHGIATRSCTHAQHAVVSRALQVYLCRRHSFSRKENSQQKTKSCSLCYDLWWRAFIVSFTASNPLKLHFPLLLLSLLHKTDAWSRLIFYINKFLSVLLKRIAFYPSLLW